MVGEHMKLRNVFIYAIALTLFTAGVIFSTTASYTQDAPLSLTTIGIFMIVIFAAYTWVLMRYRKRTIQKKENRI